MTYRPWPLIAVLIVGGLLATGCRTARSASGKQPHGDSASAERSGPAERPSEAALEKQAAAHAHYAAGVVHDFNDEPGLALEEFYKAAQNDPADESLVLEVSRRLLQSKQPGKALEVLRSAASKPGASGAIYERLGMTYLMLGKNKEAIEADRTAIKLLPRSLGGYQNLFLAFLENEQPEDALRALDDAVKQQNADAEFLMGISEMYANYVFQFPTRREDVRAKGLAVLARAEKMEITGMQSRLRLADGFFALGDDEKAASLYLESVGQLNDLPVLREIVRARLADIYIHSKDRKRAVEQLEAIVRTDPSNAQANYCLGSIAFEDKRWAEAAEFFAKALLFNPDLEQAYYELASVQIAGDKGATALATLEKARGKFPQSFMLEYLTGVAFSQQTNYPQAVKHLTTAEAIAQAGNSNQLTKVFYFQAGIANERNGSLTEAAKCFEKSLKLDPNFPDALNYLGYMWAEGGTNLDKARDMIGKALKAEPKNAAYLDSMGWVLFKLNRPKEALDYVLKAVGLVERPDAILYDHLGDIYAALHQMDKAREAWQKSLAIQPNDRVRQKLESSKTN